MPSLPSGAPTAPAFLPTALVQGMQDLMRENDDGVSVMQWLRSAYQADWVNLLERLKPKMGGLDPR